MLSILGFFLAIIWFVLPFVIFAIKGKVDRLLIVNEEMEKRLARIEELLKTAQPPTAGAGATSAPPRTPPCPEPPPSAEE